MANFTGQLRSNEIFSALYNMIISQEVFADNIKGTNSALVDKARVDGSIYGDTKLYFSNDALESVDWLNDEEAANLLELHRPEPPKVQAICIDTFKQIRLTIDDYLSKRSWSTEGAFSSFNSVMLGWMRNTKKIYDSTLYNAFIGTTETAKGLQTQNITVNANDNLGLKVAEKLANILVELKDVSRDFNDYGNIRSYDESDLMVVWNSEVYNAIKKIDLPVIFHKDGLTDEFEQHVLPAKYFGTVAGTSGTATVGDTNNSIRSLVEKSYKVANAAADPRAKLAKDGNYYVHCFPGELLPAKVTYNKAEAYTQNNNVAFKVIHKKSVPYMSAFEAGTSFFNARALTTNHYLTFGHNTLEYLKNYPFITVTVTEA